MSLQDAARACGMCNTQVRPLSSRWRAGTAPAFLRAQVSRISLASCQFKLQCRKLRISKWPSRQLRSIQHLIEETTTASGRLDLSARNRTELEGWVGELKTLQVRL